MVLKVEKKIWN